MMKFALRIVLPIVLIFSLVSCTTDPVSKVSPAEAAKASLNYEYSNDETELANLVNVYRAGIGLNKLQLISYVSTKAEEHDEYMIQVDEPSHAGFKERADDIIEVLGAKRVNENVAYDFSTAKSVLNAWLNSPSHRANIEGDFTDFGIAIRTNPQTGKKYYTNIFVKK